MSCVLLRAAVLCAAAATGLALVAPALGSDDIAIQVDRERVATQLGRKFAFRTTISNASSTETNSLIAHLNVLSLRDGVYVDPEDWSSQRTWYLGSIPAGGSKGITWKLQAVNPGSFATYVTVLPQRAVNQTPITSAAIEVAVASRRTINSGGILPLALGVPCLIGLLAGGMRAVRKRG